jgi:AraC-like DNA-binding protein
MDASNHMFFRPSFPLRDVIDHYWFVEVFKSVDGNVSSHRQIHLPEGCIDLYLDYHNSYHKTSLGNKDLGIVQSIILGTRNIDNIVMCHGFSVPFKGIRIRFTVQGFYKIFRTPINYLHNKIIPSDEVIGNAFKVLMDQIELARNNHERKKILDQFFITQLSRNSDKNINTAGCLEALQIIGTYKGNIKLAELAKSMKRSERYLEYHFKTVTGFSPKDYCINLRLNHVMKRLANPKPFRWHDLVADFGYYDQAHLINDFKKATTITPKYFLKNNFKQFLFGNSLLIITEALSVRNDMEGIYETYKKSNERFLNYPD